MSELHKEISVRIQYLMRALNMNQEQFAKLLDVTQPAVSKYLKDRIPPSLVLLKLAQATNTSIEWILTGEIKKSLRKVAENSSQYIPPANFAEKVSRLPYPIQKRLDELLETLLLSYENNRD